MRFIPEHLSKDQLHELQEERLKTIVAQVYEHSPFYAKAFRDAGIHPQDIRTLDDLQRLPLTDKDDLQLGYPFPMRAVPFEKIVRIHASSGTTGKRKVMCYTAKDVDVWADMFARCYEIAGLTTKDRVQLAVGYGLWTAGAGFQAGCERFGAMTIPLGPANVDMHCDLMVDMQTTVFCATASMALLMAEEIHKRDLLPKIHVNKIILGAERHSEAMRERIKTLMGVEEIYDIYGMTELYGPGTGLDCQYHQGIHYWADLLLFEVLDPVTLKPVSAGKEGELVVTTLCKEGSPLIRYRTHDITRLIGGECPCGVSLPRHDRILGRTDDMFIYRGVNIYPSQIDHVLSSIDGIGSEYQIHLTHEEDGRDGMNINVERAKDVGHNENGALAKYIAMQIRQHLLVRTNVELVDYGTLPRTIKKSQRVFDSRNGSH